jgi:hypothetical protein
MYALGFTIPFTYRQGCSRAPDRGVVVSFGCVRGTSRAAAPVVAAQVEQEAGEINGGVITKFVKT